jgi:hypothetical protein
VVARGYDAFEAYKLYHCTAHVVPMLPLTCCCCCCLCCLCCCCFSCCCCVHHQGFCSAQGLQVVPAGWSCE